MHQIYFINTLIYELQQPKELEGWKWFPTPSVLFNSSHVDYTVTLWSLDQDQTVSGEQRPFPWQLTHLSQGCFFGCSGSFLANDICSSVCDELGWKGAYSNSVAQSQQHLSKNKNSTFSVRVHQKPTDGTIGHHQETSPHDCNHPFYITSVTSLQGRTCFPNCYFMLLSESILLLIG